MIKKRFKIFAVLALVFVMLFSFTACGEESIGSAVSDFFSKNYWDATKSRIGFEDTMRISGRTVTFTLDGEIDTTVESLLLSETIEIAMPADKGVKVIAEIEKSTLPDTVAFYLRVGYLNPKTKLTSFKDILLINDGKNLLPVIYYPPLADCEIVSYCFFASNVAVEDIGAYVQLKGIKIISVKR